MRHQTSGCKCDISHVLQQQSHARAERAAQKLPDLQRDHDLLLGETLLDGAVKLPHKPLARPHVQHQIDIANINALHYGS